MATLCPVGRESVQHSARHRAAFRVDRSCGAGGPARRGRQRPVGDRSDPL